MVTRSITHTNSTARKLPIQKCIGKVAVQLKSHGESEIVRNYLKYLGN